MLRIRRASTTIGVEGGIGVIPVPFSFAVLTVVVAAAAGAALPVGGATRRWLPSTTGTAAATAALAVALLAFALHEQVGLGKFLHELVEFLALGLVGDAKDLLGHLLLVGLAQRVGRLLQFGADNLQPLLLGGRVRVGQRRLALELGVDRLDVDAALLQNFLAGQRLPEEAAPALAAALALPAGACRAGFQLEFVFWEFVCKCITSVEQS